MTFSYDESNVGDSEKDQIRLMIGDTNSDESLLSDEEINYILGRHSNLYGAAAEACEAIVAQYSKRSDSSVFDNLDIDLSQVVEQYRELAQEFRRKSLVASTPFAGGISVSDKDSREDDSDRVSPRFKRGLHDN